MAQANLMLCYLNSKGQILLTLNISKSVKFEIKCPYFNQFKS